MIFYSFGNRREILEPFRKRTVGEMGQEHAGLFFLIAEKVHKSGGHHKNQKVFRRRNLEIKFFSYFAVHEHVLR